MSYILDALRKAESERERGKVPGLNAQTQAAQSFIIQPRPWWTRPLMWVGIGLCAGLLVAGTARWLMPNSLVAFPPQAAIPARGGEQPGAEPAQTPQPSAHTTRRSPSPDTSWMQPLEPQKELAAPSPAPAAAPSTPRPRVPSRPEPASQQLTPPEPRFSPPAGVPRVATRSAPPSSTASPATPAIQGLGELPEDLRRQLPPLSIGGSSYSENPEGRLLIVNGQVFHEGDQLTNELRLERIELKAAVLSFKGYRYRMTF